MKRVNQENDPDVEDLGKKYAYKSSQRNKRHHEKKLKNNESKQ